MTIMSSLRNIEQIKMSCRAVEMMKLKALSGMPDNLSLIPKTQGRGKEWTSGSYPLSPTHTVEHVHQHLNRSITYA